MILSGNNSGFRMRRRGNVSAPVAVALLTVFLAAVLAFTGCGRNVTDQQSNVKETGYVVSADTPAPAEDATKDPAAASAEVPGETRNPADMPSPEPSDVPSDVPSEPAVTTIPTEEITAVPSQEPTPAPTETAASSATPGITATPVITPTLAPTQVPTPTKTPAPTPTKAPTQTPTPTPTKAPTQVPTPTPTKAPTATPTAVPTATPAPTPETYPVTNDGTLRVLQFNIQTENGNSTAFSVRAEMYKELLDELMPDVVGMEECTTNWRRWLDSYVFNDSYAGVGEPRTVGGEANPIYYRKDKFDLIDSGTFWLSDTPDVAGSYLEGVNYPRICTWVVLRDKASGTEFIHMNTHLDHNGKNNSTDGNAIRKNQMGVIIKFAQQYKNLPMFLTGDLNNRRTTSAGNKYALIKIIEGDSKYKDAEGKKYSIKLADARLNAPVTVDGDHLSTMMANYDESSASYNPSKEPIDYIFYNPANTEALTYETFLISRGSMQISDHLPVFATFRFTEGS